MATITTMAEARNRLRFNCTACQTICEHIGAAVSLVLEEKTALGLAAAPDERRPLETLSEQELLEQALRDRQERARTEKFRLRSSDPQQPWTDYTITSALSGKTYRVALRGEERGDSFCSCPDFRTNTLGTCKHILHVLHRVQRRFPAAARRKPYRNREAFVHVLYGEEVTLRLQLPDRPDPELVKAVGSLADGPIDDVRRLVDCLTRLERLGRNVTVYPDAEELIQRRLFEQHMADRMAEIQKDPARHPLRKQLLKVELLPVSTRRDRLCRGGRPGDPGRRHGPGQDDPGRGRRRDPRPRGRHRPRAGGLPRLAEIAVAQRNPPLLRPQRATGHRRRRRAGPAIRQRLLLHRLQLRAGAARHPGHRARPLGPDHPRRRPADQELGVEDGPGHQGPQVAVRAGPQRHAAGEPAGRVVLGGPVRRRPPPAAGLPLLPSPSRGGREREGAGLQEPGPVAREPAADPAAAARASRCSSSFRRGPARSSASRPPTSRSSCTTPTCASCR